MRFFFYICMCVCVCVCVCVSFIFVCLCLVEMEGEKIHKRRIKECKRKVLSYAMFFFFCFVTGALCFYLFLN